jgi:hypothetical protein
MFFQFAAWNQFGPVLPLPPPQLLGIEALFRLHPGTLLRALEHFYSTRTPIPDTPNFTFPVAVTPYGAKNLEDGITACLPNQRWHHLAYAYMVENTRAFEIFDRVVREYEGGERFETPDPDTALWLRTTQALFFKDLGSDYIGSLTNVIRPDGRAIRRNAYYRLLGLDLNHGLDGNRPYPFDKPSAANRDFVPMFESFQREVWRGSVNAANTSGPNDTDNAIISDTVRLLRDMLLVRRINGNLLREEFWAVVTLSWFHLSLMEDTPIVRALKAEAESPAERLRKIGERVSVPMHARSDDYFSMAVPLATVLSFIEADTAQNGPAYFTPPTDQLPTDVRTVSTHWSRATGHDIKANRVTQATPFPGIPYRPLMATRV